MVREGELDGGIISSYEYLKNRKIYKLLRFCIASREVCSVLLLSNRRLENLKEVELSNESLTSNQLLKVLLKLKGIRVSFKRGAGAKLIIGDEAIKRKGEYKFYYDLAKEWYKIFKLPFVFAVFVLRKERRGFSKRLNSVLEGSLKSFYRDFNSLKFPYDREFAKKYFFECLNFKLGKEEVRSLKAFKGLLEKGAF